MTKRRADILMIDRIDYVYALARNTYMYNHWYVTDVTYVTYRTYNTLAAKGVGYTI